MYLVGGLTFLFSLCGATYQFLLVRAITPFVHDEVLCQSLVLGTYLLGMGLGAAQCGRSSDSPPLKRLFRREVLVAAMGAAMVPMLSMLLTLLELFSDHPWWSDRGTLNSPWKVAFFLPLSLAIGALTGAEIPLFTHWLEKKGHSTSLSSILGCSYLGSLAGAIAISFWLVPKLGLAQAALFTSLLTLAGAVGLFLLAQREACGLARLLLSAFSVTALAFLSSAIQPRLDQALWKTTYLDLRLPRASLGALRDWWHALEGFTPVEHFETTYQTIDLIPDRFLLSDPKRSDFAMYLNFQPQFVADTERGYHESMAFSPLAFHGLRPKHALVLGGGDGLLARDLLRSGVEKLTIVELDPGMLALATNHPRLSELNRKSLTDPRVRVIVGDAFTFVRYSAEKFDAVFADLPFPASYDLLKLYSVEFYAAIRRITNPQGVLVLDAPVWSDRRILAQAPRPWPQEILRATLNAAGWKSVLAFGPIEPFLLAAEEAPSAHYEELPRELSGRALLDLAPISWVFPEDTPPKQVNYALRPRRIRW